MTLDEKIRKSINEALEETALLFNDVDDVDEDARAALRAVRMLTPLLTDIKTEVKSIENTIKTHPLWQKPEEEDDQKDEEEGQDDTSPVEDPEIQEIMDDVKENAPKAKKLRKKLKDAIKDALIPKGETTLSPRTQNNVPDIPGMADASPYIFWASMFIKAWRDHKISKDYWSKVWNNFQNLKGGQITTNQFLKDEFGRGMERVQDHLSNDLQDSTDTVNDWIEEETDKILERLFQLGENMGQCCHNMTNGLDDVGHAVGKVQRDLDQLEPKAQAGRELLSLQKATAILSEVQAIRGLL